MISTVPHMTDQDLAFSTMPPLIEVRQDGDDRRTTLQPTVLHDHLCCVVVPDGALTRAEADGIWPCGRVPAVSCSKRNG